MFGQRESSDEAVKFCRAAQRLALGDVDVCPPADASLEEDQPKLEKLHDLLKQQ